jgi:hypothetical protein
MSELKPTYTKKEASEMMLILDYEGLVILGKLIIEEKNQYSSSDLIKLYRLLKLCVKITRILGNQ